MSTIKDFENAPVGATATHKMTGGRAMRVDGVEWRWIRTNGLFATDEQMKHWGYTLDPSVPVTAREALYLAWELAHEVKPGQVIPKGDRLLEFYDSGLKEYTAQRDIKIDPDLAPVFRTLDPLPDPEPDWLDAPAILASHPLCADTEPIGLWIPASGEGMWEWPHGEFEAHWSELEDVTPLYPKEGHDAGCACGCGEGRTQSTKGKP